MDRAPRSFARPLLFLLSGPLIWFAHFSFIYAMAGFGGALGIAPEGVRSLAWAATLAAGAAIVFMLVLAQMGRAPRDRETDAAIHEITGALAALALLAVLLEAAVLWIIPM